MACSMASSRTSLLRPACGQLDVAPVAVFHLVHSALSPHVVEGMHGEVRSTWYAPERLTNWHVKARRGATGGCFAALKFQDLGFAVVTLQPKG